ncbi:MAG: type II toxin-antitoxin system VapC family toxin [Actinobacteria bacterium]|nr:type II toxin-antitoxin system VapC family toxin [Actinomycetota bacterium]
MKERIYADTNIFIRFFADDIPEQTEISKRILKGLLENKYELYLCDLVFAEIVYVLESYYKLGKKDILDKMFAILKFKNLVVENKSIIVEALEIYNEKNIDFTDAYMACHARKAGCNKLFSFDKDFTRINFLKIISV